ncbi:SixA phosphatase family protein [Pseudohongiella sp.]|uniref:Phosphohistidine phosphatase SixA n=1 Tax=marine sediment metagenome TaxID=412755 RepID=A0A0F9VSB5_9ZZZZ|nr:histidine phosphatase family protein [Pseudohongiella sp.]HDZ10173.1 histidine phosphatase family protein [Pseudohongiella sp.]HEA64296.1 histidine phosphatase family protein [Pseudohongiella sp.]
MKTLILLRHAKSSWQDQAQRDIDRPLNERGRQDAPLMADNLHKRGTHPQRILCSPALRTVSTAEIFANHLSIPKELLQLERQIYLAGSGHLLHLMRQQDDKLDSMMLVGHNPALTDLFNELCREARLDNMPTCCVAELSLPITQWSRLDVGQAELKYIDYPKKII